MCIQLYARMQTCVRVCTDLGRRSKQLRCLKMTVHILFNGINIYLMGMENLFKFSKQNSHDLVKCPEISQS